MPETILVDHKPPMHTELSNFKFASRSSDHGKMYRAKIGLYLAGYIKWESGIINLDIWAVAAIIIEDYT